MNRGMEEPDGLFCLILLQTHSMSAPALARAAPAAAPQLPGDGASPSPAGAASAPGSPLVRDARGCGTLWGTWRRPLSFSGRGLSLHRERQEHG